jgi:hypothetical protein
MDMIKIELLTPSYDGQAVEWRRLAALEAEGDRFTWLEGDQSLLDFGVPVIDLLHQRRISFDENAEEWVRWLPTIFRGGDLVINVIEDTNPIPSELFETPNDGDEPLDLAEPLVELRESVWSHSRARA